VRGFLPGRISIQTFVRAVPFTKGRHQGGILARQPEIRIILTALGPLFWSEFAALATARPSFWSSFSVLVLRAGERRLAGAFPFVIAMSPPAAGNPGAG
jgi:hypothetical protein